MSKSSAFRESGAPVAPESIKRSAAGRDDADTLLGASVYRRLGWLGFLLVALWAGVYWALR